MNIDRVFQLDTVKLIHIILPQITYSDEIYNCSFIDGMNFDCKWETLFRGTVYLNLNKTSTQQITQDIV